MTFELEIPSTLNIGCSQCGDPAVRAIMFVDDKVMEVIESQCPEHASVEAV